jgi:hypothetical protein
LDVATTTTPASKRAVNRRPRIIIASAMSSTWNSSKHKTAACAAMSAAVRVNVSGWLERASQIGAHGLDKAEIIA